MSLELLIIIAVIGGALVALVLDQVHRDRLYVGYAVAIMVAVFGVLVTASVPVIFPAMTQRIRAVLPEGGADPVGRLFDALRARVRADPGHPGRESGSRGRPGDGDPEGRRRPAGTDWSRRGAIQANGAGKGAVLGPTLSHGIIGRDGAGGRPTAVEVSVVMPCLNEADTLATCIAQGAARRCASTASPARSIVADNGSTDGSLEIAARARRPRRHGRRARATATR